MLKLSVLDQSVALAGRPQADSITETLALAQTCEALGYQRFWVSEHHNHPSIVGSAPEVLLAAIAQRTQRIRIGSAGVMLPHYAALKVAEQFRVLDALAPGRVDLGLGRAPGSDGRTAQLLNPQRHTSELFAQQVLDLRAWVNAHELPHDHPGFGVQAYPHGPSAPTLWMLGSSDYGARLAAQLSLPYAFAWFITEGQGAAEALQAYRNLYQPSPQQPTPQATICVWALAADTEDQAWHLFQSRARWRLDRDLGRLGPMLPPEAAARDMTLAEKFQLDRLRRDAIVGSPAMVGDKLRALSRKLQVDEIVVLTWTHDPQARRHSYELLAQEFALGNSD